MIKPASLPRALAPTATLEQRLERGEILYFPACPFSLPEGDDRSFLFQQRQDRLHKNIALNPHTGHLGGFCRQPTDHVERLRDLLRDFGAQAADWLANLLPGYAAGWRQDRITLRPEEEATRSLPQTARNDLLHLDAFPDRPSHGARILRLFVNLNLAEPRIWATSDTFAKLFARFGPAVGLPAAGAWTSRLRDGLLRLFNPNEPPRGEYDSFMLRFHNFLKTQDDFQEHCRKRFWKFPPNALWLAFTDGVSHAELRGRYALEHSFFVPRSCLALPDEAPAAILDRACAAPAQRRAA